MPPSLLHSQYDTLEPLEPDEPGVESRSTAARPRSSPVLSPPCNCNQKEKARDPPNRDSRRR